MSYLKQINRAVDFIEAHLCEVLTIDEVAREAGLSRWHFQRIFASTVGETVGDYISTRRLSNAAFALLSSDQRVIAVALDYGYQSHAAFTRAFARVFGMTPSAFRRAKKNASIVPQKIRLTPQYLDHLYRGISMTPEITTLDGFTAIGIAGHFSPLNSSEPDNMTVIPKLWQTFRSHAGFLPEEKLGTRVGVIGAGAAPDGRMDYLAGKKALDTIEPPVGFEIRDVPAGTYAKFTHKGPMRNISHTMHYIFGAWLPRSGRLLGEGPEFGEYPPEYDPTSEDGEMYIYIPLK